MSVTKLWRVWATALVVVALAWLALQELLPNGGGAEVAVRHGARLPTIPPAPRPMDPTAELESLSKSTLWGPIAQRPASGASDAGASAAPEPKWSLTGFYAVSGTKYVIVSFEQMARPSQQLKVHDKLPDGARIEAIEPDRVRVRAPRVNLPDGAASDVNPSRSSSWLSITPGLPLPPPRERR